MSEEEEAVKPALDEHENEDAENVAHVKSAEMIETPNLEEEALPIAHPSENAEIAEDLLQKSPESPEFPEENDEGQGIPPDEYYPEQSEYGFTDYEDLGYEEDSEPLLTSEYLNTLDYELTETSSERVEYEEFAPDEFYEEDEGEELGSAEGIHPSEVGEVEMREPPTSASSKSSSVKVEKLHRPSFLKKADLDTCLIPFHLKWSFGVGDCAPVLNVTTKHRNAVFYATSHAAVLYDFTNKSMRLLQGHKNLISCISVDESGKWLVSVDKGEENTIIVWDSTECIPVNTVFDPHPNCGTAVVGISGNAKYLATIGNETKPIFHFWLWTYGSDVPDDSYTIPSGYKLPIKICFNPDVQEHIMVALQRQIIFFQWDSLQNKLLPPIFPSVRQFKKVGLITDCTYMDKCHECAAVTNAGYVLVFGTTLYTLPYDEAALQNIKVFSKAIRVSTNALNCVASKDGVIVTGDTNGYIKFYDKTIRILYWCQNFTLPSITNISFNLTERLYKLKSPYEYEDILTENDESCHLNNYECEDRSEEFEYLYSQLVPSDATIHRFPFIVRDFLVATVDGRIASIDYMHNKCKYFFRKVEGNATAIDTHDEKPYVVVGYSNGNISLYDYEMCEFLTGSTLPIEEPIEEEYAESSVAISSIKYSPECLHLACGTANGALWFLNPVILKPKYLKPFSWTSAKVKSIAFSLDSKLIAYYDENSTMILMKYFSTDDRWEFCGKIRSHCQSINDILFTPYLPSRLFSIGQDRYLVEYDLEHSSLGNIELITRERIEQTAIPICFVYYPIKHTVGKYLLVSDNMSKYKLVHDETFMCRSVMLGPAYGCYKNFDLRKLQVLPVHQNKYVIFADDRHIGIQMIPTNGNPYEYIGTIGHPSKLVDFRLSHEGKYIFTIGEEDSCVLMWHINVLAVQLLSKIGGIDLEPFYCLIEGGINGWLFREMQDLFYYMQILHQGENTVLPRIVTDEIPITELPDLMRACGFYPSDYEIENMIVDVKYRDYDVTKELKDNVSFLEFVKLYINHRPTNGISMQSLQGAFETVCVAGDGPGSNTIYGSSFVETLCDKGEIFSFNKARTCLATLMRCDDTEDDDTNGDFSFMPDVVNYEVFLQDILGMDLQRQPIDDEEGNVKNEEDDLC